MFNGQQAGLTYWAPNINIFRDPRWGRGQETPGEDPFLSSQYAIHFIRGMQGADLNQKYLKVSSCAKHFAAYSMENSDGTDRDHFNAVVDQEDFNRTYFPAFKWATLPIVEGGGGASSVMCSYNAVNGIPSCANDFLLRKYLRGEWKFDGYVTGDCGAVYDVRYTHNYTSSDAETDKVVYEAGLNTDCGQFTSDSIVTSVTSGSLSRSLVEHAIYQLTLVQMRLGLFDGPKDTPWASLGPADMCTQSALDVSLEAAREGVVLLRNVVTLPLSIQRYPTAALIGPSAASTSVMRGNYYGHPPFIRSVLDGLLDYYPASSLLYSPGLVDVGSNSTLLFPPALDAARTASVTIYVGGLDQNQESEGNDRTSLLLPGAQADLIDQLISASRGPVILIFLSGNSHTQARSRCFVFSSPFHSFA